MSDHTRLPECLSGHKVSYSVANVQIHWADHSNRTSRDTAQLSMLRISIRVRGGVHHENPHATLHVASLTSGIFRHVVFVLTSYRRVVAKMGRLKKSCLKSFDKVEWFQG